MIIAKLENRSTVSGERSFVIIANKEKNNHDPSLIRYTDILTVQSRFIFPAIAVLGGACGLIAKIAGLY